MINIKKVAHACFQEVKSCVNDVTSIGSQVQGSVGTIEKIAKAGIKTVAAVKAVTGAALPAISSVTTALSGVTTVVDLLNPLGTIHYFIKWADKGCRDNWAKKAFMVDLVAINALAFTGGLSKLKLIDTSKISAVAAKIPVIGQTLSRFNIGAMIQPLLVVLSILNIANQRIELNRTTKDQAQAELKKRSWTHIKAEADDGNDYDNLLKAHFKDRKKNKGADLAYVEKEIKDANLTSDEEITKFIFAKKREWKATLERSKPGDPSKKETLSKLKAWKSAAYVERKTMVYASKSLEKKKAHFDKKIVKYDAKIHNAKKEKLRSWISVAVDILKIASAAVTFTFLIGTVATGLPVAAATLAAVAALAALGKVLYDLYHKEHLKPVNAVKFA